MYLGSLWLWMLVVLSGPRLWAAGGRCRAASIGYTMLIHLFPFAPAASTGPTRWVLFWTPPPLAGAQDTAAAQKSPGWLWFHPASLHCVPTRVSRALQPEGTSACQCLAAMWERGAPWERRASWPILATCQRSPCGVRPGSFRATVRGEL